MTRAMTLAIHFGFITIGLERIWAETDTDNRSAIKLLERLNFIKTGQTTNNNVVYELVKR